jgi:tetratricopeptide (TPR) repeat protein
MCPPARQDADGHRTPMSIDRALELQARAWTLQSEGKLDGALEACREALQLIEQCEGTDSLDAANLLNDLAQIECDRQNFQPALINAERALAIEESQANLFTGETAARIRLKTLALLGELRRIQGDYVRAEGHLQEGVRLAAAEFGKVSEESAQAINDLAVLHKYCGRFDDGLRLYKEALQITIATQGEECVTAITIYHNLGGILFSQGNFAAAKPYGEKAWRLSQRLLGESDPRTLADAAAFAAILDGLGRYDESETIYRRALAVFEESFGPVHYEVAATLHNLAAVLCARGYLDEAEQLYRRALAIKEKLLAVGSADAALTRNNLGALLNLTGRPKEAAALLESAMEILQNQLAPDHPYLALARANLKQALLSSMSQDAEHPTDSLPRNGRG